MIQIENLKKTYRTGFWLKSRPALGGVSISVPKGSIYGFIGPNGAGKSTTIKVLTGLLRADSGRVLINGFPAGSVKSRRFLGYLPEQPYFYDYLTGRELLKFYGSLADIPNGALASRIDFALEMVSANKPWIDRRLRTYSKGMMQRVGLAQAILSQPEVLILDEPMSGLDPVGRRDVREAIYTLNQSGITVFYSSHLLSDVESISHRVAMIVEGKIVREGTINEVTGAEGVQYRIQVREEIHAADLPAGVSPSMAHHGEFICDQEKSKNEFFAFCLSRGFSIERVEHERPSLEDILTQEIARAERN
ncbi:MAG: ABC transporter ATP-binding protein [Fibrobacter sp.]|jgi:ABC-2 type transport system ATP-binding protein|nr:ABC transporter ATP-binding protein [Fibrobacter sp.]